MTDYNVKSVKRFAAAPKVAEIPETMADAAASVANIGEVLASADRLLTLAVARTLIDATAKGSDEVAIVGEMGFALDQAQLGSGPAKRASRAMGAALRVAKAAASPLSGKAALTEATEIVAGIFDHDTKRRQERRKQTEARAAKAKADKAEESAEKARAKAEAQESDGVPIERETVCNALVGPDGDAVETFDAEELAIMVELAGILRNVAVDERAAMVQAARDYAIGQERGARQKVHAVG